MKKPFEPQLLPIKFENEEIIKLNKKVIKARELIKEINVRTEHSKLSETFFYLFSVNESLQSTRIEGTQSSFNEIIQAEATLKYNNDTLEIKNYIEALNKGIITLRDLPIGTRLIKIIHKEMLKSGRGSNRNVGEYRKVQNWIGGKNIEDAKHIPPIADKIDLYMSNLETYINDVNDELDELIRIAIIHAQFETIHPFLDGNGRVGRLLIILYLYERGLINNKTFNISEEIEKNKLKYYAYLDETRKENSNWIGWINFFLDSVINQSKRNIEKLKMVEKLYDVLIKEVKSNKLKYEYIDYIFRNPIFSINNLSSSMNIKYTTAKNNIKKFEDLKYVFSDGKRKNRLYFFYDLLRIFND
ncbi:Fic family protein [Streptobacillus moniliformis]|uniref:Fic family protein n=1 Tax=Streptobacillus moniliformis TaxID=34105 RepID=UPI0007E4CA7B|nr:Fic family protein [Streptobacillus moniliformis]